ncbi:hypothetical protein QWI17_05800 [Gilvimarinus sp. SDUM040013]|uniref:RiboL-PSP-HEPN domain-containing protein n=1 Tax=Gilvimarinus gilvus TaxID=3058038 RepID=A0ABU4S1G0_9GAMM|nr:hypothetical protein [Gilvimarinus sp. SDUM040013]MDO3385352.1 hypothetical protein [Gilvimarinus sp. SDUM040013]MDX6850927.1 hypothetical protein [Gilvimarinus sp. SDUM040013]
MEFDHESIAKRVVELSGGKEKLNEEMDQKLARVNEKWNQDVGAIGRILRAHLFVEYFITECLIAFNPALGNPDKARLSFAQKLALIEDYSPELQELAGGIRRLNKIRNQLAHKLEAQITDQDRESLLSVKSFRALREQLAKPGTPSDNGMDVLEDFAKHVGSRLSSLADPDSLAKRFQQAFHEFEKRT